MKIAGIAGLLAVVTAVTGAAIPNTLSNAVSKVDQASDKLADGVQSVTETTSLGKRDDPISGLADQILPSLTKQGVLPNVVSLDQLTGLLNILQLNGLLGNVEPLLGSLLNGLPLKGLTGGLLGGLLQRDDPISGLAGKLLPSLTKQGVLPNVVSLDQLTGLLNILKVNGLLGNVEQLLGGLLNGLPLKGLTGGL